MKAVLDPGSTPGRSTRKNTVADFTSMSRILKSALEIGYSVLPNGPEFGFDRAMSKDMDNTVGDDCQSSKTITANAANDEVYALAA